MTFNFTAGIGQQPKKKVNYQQFFYELVNNVHF